MKYLLRVIPAQSDFATGDRIDARRLETEAEARRVLAQIGEHAEARSAGDPFDAIIAFIGNRRALAAFATGDWPTALPTIVVVPPEPAWEEMEPEFPGDVLRKPQAAVSTGAFMWNVSSFRAGSAADLEPPGQLVQSRDVVPLLRRLMDEIDSRSSGAPLGSNDDVVRLDVELFSHIWTQVSPLLPLSPDDRRTGEALATMASEVVKTEELPHAVLLETFKWFARKVDIFTEEFAKSAGSSAGKTAGAALAVAGGAAATGQLPRLVDAVGRVLQHLG